MNPRSSNNQTTALFFLQLVTGNYPLCRVLAQIYEVSPDPLQGHAMALVSLLPHCDNQEKLALLHLFSLIAKDNPTVRCRHINDVKVCL